MSVVDYIEPSVPERYRAFLIDLENRMARELKHTFSNIRPVSANEKREPTLLERYQEILEGLAENKAINVVAKKAYKTQAGEKAFESLFEYAITIEDIIRCTPNDLEMVQRNRLNNILIMIQDLRRKIEEDKFRFQVTIGIEELEGVEILIDDGDVQCPSDNIYKCAFDGVVVDGIDVCRIFDIGDKVDRRVFRSISGKSSLYRLATLLESFEIPLMERIDSLNSSPEADPRGDQLVRRAVYLLYDALAEFEHEFEQKNMGTLRKNALVAAFVTGLFNPFEDYRSALIRVSEIINRRKKKLCD